VTTSPFTVRSFDDVIEQGVRFRTSGDYATSLAAFSKAAQLTKVPRHLTELAHERSLVFTEIGLQDAERDLNEAIYHAYRRNDKAEAYRIKRDLALIEMNRFLQDPHRRKDSRIYRLLPWTELFGYLGKAHALIAASIEGFMGLGDLQEALVSMSYLSVLEELRGHHKHAAEVFSSKRYQNASFGK
jgi:hypothetical protein